ncbi:MAG: hypothetical protein AAB270_04385, partial [Chloroflexota bacterium]
RDGTILAHERDELLRILEGEREQATKERNVAVLIALGLLIAALPPPPPPPPPPLLRLSRK